MRFRICRVSKHPPCVPGCTLEGDRWYIEVPTIGDLLAIGDAANYLLVIGRDYLSGEEYDWLITIYDGYME